MVCSNAHAGAIRQSNVHSNGRTWGLTVRRCQKDFPWQHSYCYACATWSRVSDKDIPSHQRRERMCDSSELATFLQLANGYCWSSWTVSACSPFTLTETNSLQNESQRASLLAARVDLLVHVLKNLLNNWPGCAEPVVPKKCAFPCFHGVFKKYYLGSCFQKVLFWSSVVV